MRQVGGSLGVAGVGAVIARHVAFMDGLRVGLTATVVILGITAAPSLTLRSQQHTTGLN